MSKRKERKFVDSSLNNDVPGKRSGTIGGNTTSSSVDHKRTTKRRRGRGEKEDEFSEWLHVHGADTSLIEWKECEFGRGGFAKVELSPDTIFGSLPIPLILRESYIHSLPHIKALLEILMATSGITDENARVYAFLYYMMESKLISANSFYGPYLRSLPSSYGDPLWWTEEERNELEGTNLGNALSEEERKLENAFKIIKTTSICKKSEKNLDVAYSYSDFLWARSAFMSRRFPERLCSPSCENPKFSCMLPLLDCFNHSYGTPVTWLHDPISGKIGFKTHTNIPKGQQVFNNYGAKSNEEFLMAFGFVMNNNPQDELAIAVATSFGGEALSKVRTSLLDHYEIPAKFYFKHGGELPKLLFEAMTICVMDKYQLYLMDSKPTPFNTKSSKLDLHLAGKVYSMIRRTLVRKLKILNDAHSHAGSIEGISANKMNAVVYRSGQRSILQEAIASIEEMLSFHLASLLTSAPPFVKERTPISVNKSSSWYLKWFNETFSDSICNIKWMDSVALSSASCLRGSVLLALPVDAAISIDAAANDNVFRDALVAFEDVDEETVITLYIIFLYLVKGSVSDNAHFPYLMDQFKRASANNDATILWNESELRMLGEKSMAYKVATEEIRQLREVYGDLFPQLSVQFPEIFVGSIFTYETFLLAFTIVTKLSCSLYVGNEVRTFLVPLLNGSNCSESSSCHYSCTASSSDGIISLVADMDLSENQEIFLPVEIDRFDNANLLLRFGTVIDNNAFEVVYIGEDVMRDVLSEVIEKSYTAAQSVPGNRKRNHVKPALEVVMKEMDDKGLLMWWRSHVLTSQIETFPKKFSQTLQTACVKGFEDHGVRAGVTFLLNYFDTKLASTELCLEKMKKNRSVRKSRLAIANKYVKGQRNILAKIQGI